MWLQTFAVNQSLYRCMQGYVIALVLQLIRPCSVLCSHQFNSGFFEVSKTKTVVSRGQLVRPSLFLVSFLVFITRASFPIVFNCCLSRVPLKDILYYVSTFSPIFGPIHPKPIIHLFLSRNIELVDFELRSQAAQHCRLLG